MRKVWYKWMGEEILFYLLQSRAVWRGLTHRLQLRHPPHNCEKTNLRTKALLELMQQEDGKSLSVWRCLWVAALTKPALPMLGFLLCKIISIFMFQAFLARYLLLECQSNILHHFLHGHLNSFLWTRQFLNYISNSLLLLIREAADLFVGLLSSLVITLTSSKSLSIKSLTDDYRTCK